MRTPEGELRSTNKESWSKPFARYKILEVLLRKCLHQSRAGSRQSSGTQGVREITLYWGIRDVKLKSTWSWEAHRFAGNKQLHHPNIVKSWLTKSFFFFKRSIHSSWRRLEDIRLFQPLRQFLGHKAAVNSVNVPGAAKAEGPSDREGRNLARAWLPVLCSLCLVKPMTRFWGHQRGQVTSVLRPPHKCPTPSLWTHSDLIPGVS